MNCVNCQLPSIGHLCGICRYHQQCTRCHRYLPPHCYNGQGGVLCDTCCSRRGTTPQHRHSVGRVVNEISIPTTRGAESFDAFVQANEGVITALINDYQRQYR